MLAVCGIVKGCERGRRIGAERPDLAPVHAATPVRSAECGDGRGGVNAGRVPGFGSVRDGHLLCGGTSHGGRVPGLRTRPQPARMTWCARVGFADAWGKSNTPGAAAVAPRGSQQADQLCRAC